jgi:acyl-homoserine-lactone acylase
MGYLGIRVVTLGLLATTPFSSAAARALEPPRAYDVEIVRDNYGVPHIRGRTDADAAFGLAYAQSEDNFAVIQQMVAAAQGKSGLLYGRQGAVVDYGREFLGIPGTVARDYSTLSPEVRAVLEGYAAGVNRYAQSHPKEVRLASLFPMSGRDLAGGIALVSPQFYGLDSVLARLFNDQVPAGASSTTGEKGSNAFAVAPTRMSDGKTWLIAIPHLPLEGPSALYEAVVHSGEGLDMAGATLPGSPFLLLGHSRNLGWSITLNNPDLVDVYKLTLNPKGDSYFFDGKWLPLEKRSVKLPVKAGIITTTASRFVYRSVHGPVVINSHGAFAVRYAGMDQLRMVEQYYRLTKARDWDDWQNAMSIGGIPSTNYVYADKTGRIAYIYNGLFPDRRPGYDYSGILVGDTSLNLWNRPVGFARMPKLVSPRSGYLFSANNTPFHASADADNLRLSDFSSLMGIETRMTNRAWRAEELFRAPGKITPEGLLAIKFDTQYSRQSYVGTWITNLLAVNTTGRPDLSKTQNLLASWDWNSDGSGNADGVAELFIIPAKAANMNNAPIPAAMSALESLTPATQKYMGRLDPGLSTMNQLRRGTVNLPLQGGADTLKTVTLTYDEEAKRFNVTGGDSFIMTVSWDANGQVVSNSIVPYGASNRLDSPHYADQTKMFAEKRFKPVYFEWPDAVAHGGSVYRP